MPHIIIEHNMAVDVSFIMLPINQLLADHLPTDINSCKARIYSSNQVLIGEGEGNSSFMHITIKVLSGRTKETLASVSQMVFDMVKNKLLENHVKALRLSVELLELSTIYIKS